MAWKITDGLVRIWLKTPCQIGGVSWYQGHISATDVGGFYLERSGEQTLYICWMNICAIVAVQ